ncbi:M15 family metallopeptidase [Actinophytocola sp. NPDC049390]|uniref:M15 family metallopeptidase n=1 Tax=Actinophytocola sp. NPDC049390 TaxID=3363894 RepID=UPI0037B7AA43
MTRPWAAPGTVLALLALLAGCGLPDATGEPPRPPARVADATTESSEWEVADPGPLRGGLLRADLLVLAPESLPGDIVESVRAVPGVREASALSVASVPVAERTITVAGVDPSAYRRFTPEVTAESDAVWRSVAKGETVIGHGIGRDLRQPPGSVLEFANRPDLGVRVGAHAVTVPHVDAVVNDRRAAQLGIVAGNALLVSAAPDRLAEVAAAVRTAVTGRATLQPLTATTPRTGSRQAAHLTGGTVARAVGTFSYEYFPDGTVRPDARWVAANIRTDRVPLLGQVTCHRTMLPRLRAALTEVVRTGLADAIDAGDYGGCYVPRFIGHDPNRGLSLHTWGIAIDLNVATNQRGTAGRIDRRVVDIFARWGFAWGGTWRWTDPMHFELARLVTVP